MRIQFILKKNEVYGFVSYTRRSSGLWNSTRFVVEAMQVRGIDAEIVEVRDNNDIDREVARFKPDVVVIEALWVVPEKFPILRKLHPGVKWFVHLHSHMPFLALEGIAMDWILRYGADGVGLIANSMESYQALLCILSPEDLIYLPNVYLGNMREIVDTDQDKDGVIDVGCFGAMRPLKNHLIQALAAIQFAREKNKVLRFHINGTRTETGGEPVLKNLRQLFAYQPGASLVQHPWMEPQDFLNLLHSAIDIGMQVSLTETFCVVAADYVTAGVPIVVSKEVSWAADCSKTADNSVGNIVHVMRRAYGSTKLPRWNQHLLRRYSARAQRAWFDFCVREGA